MITDIVSESFCFMGAFCDQGRLLMDDVRIDLSDPRDGSTLVSFSPTSTYQSPDATNDILAFREHFTSGIVVDPGDQVQITLWTLEHLLDVTLCGTLE